MTFGDHSGRTSMMAEHLKRLNTSTRTRQREARPALVSMLFCQRWIVAPDALSEHHLKSKCA
jgi:hypothetical protein